MNSTVLEEKQAKILQDILAYQTPAGTQIQQGILNEVWDYSESEVVYAMGDFGLRLRAFSKEIDLFHPDIREIYNGQLIDAEKDSFSRDARDTLRLAAYGQKSGLSENVLENLKRIINKNEHYPLLNRVIDAPSNNQLHVRFVKSYDLRQQIRRQKSCQLIGLSSLYKKGQAFWHGTADNFETYHYKVNRYQKDIDHVSGIKNNMSMYGLNCMSEHVDRSLEEIKAKAASESFHGFNRISLVTASVILAKMCNYTMEEKIGYGYYSSSHNYAVYAQKDSYPNFDFFWEDFGNDLYPITTKIEYTPKAYMYEELRSVASDKMWMVIDCLENHPAMGGKPLFDYYRVLVPTICYPSSSQGPVYHFKTGDGNTENFDDLPTAQFKFDQALLASKAVPAILLGERDGDHYFVSYWT